MRIGIVGGGIAGLTAAIALGPDHDVTLFERAEPFTTAGAGIVVSANAGRALRSLGVSLNAIGRRVAESTLASSDGRPLQIMDLAAAEGTRGPTVAVARSDLHRLLTEAVPSSVVVRHGCLVESVVPERSTVVIAGEHLTFDLLVGADGINSRVRAASSNAGRIMPAGVACWRALVEPTVDDGPVEYLGANQRVGVVGLPNGTYLYLVESADPGALADLDSTELRDRFRGFKRARYLLEAIDDTPRFDDLAELARPVWGNEQSVLIGDAAHAMTPNLGQGASMAIEDAVVLAQRIRDGGTDWFEDFVAERAPRVRWVQLTSRRLGRALHARSAPAQALRNAILRHTPRAVSRRPMDRLLAGGPIPAHVDPLAASDATDPAMFDGNAGDRTL